MNQPSIRTPQDPDLEFLDSAVCSPTSFLREDPWRVFRIQSDMIQAIEVMTRALEGPCRSVAIFGSASLKESDPPYQLARRTSQLLGERGFAIITGGGPGIMEAGNRGARDAGSVSRMPSIVRRSTSVVSVGDCTS